MMFRCWRCGTWGLRIRHVCTNCWKQNLKDIRRMVKDK